MKRIKKLSLLLVVLMVIGLFPAGNVYAINLVEGGHEEQGNAYDWGTYNRYKSSLTVVLNEDQEKFWISYQLPAKEHIFASCSYSDKYEGMKVEMKGVTSNTAFSPTDVRKRGTVLAFLPVIADNTTSSTQTFYICITRPQNYSGKMYVSITLKERIKTGRGVFDFRGTARNRGNNPFKNSGSDSSVISLDLRNESRIPRNAIVTSVATKGRMSPEQGHVRHMIRPTKNSSQWFTSRVSSADSGSYYIDKSNNFDAKQMWEFKYNGKATGSSSMSRVRLEMAWEYDLQYTDFETQLPY